METFGPSMSKELLDEATVMEKCHHSNVIAFFGISFHENKSYLVMELASRGSLHQLLLDDHIKLEWRPIRIDIAYNIAKGLHYLHSLSIVHRDLKSLNILLDEHLKAKISDFGLAKMKLLTAATTVHVKKKPGTTRWTAPELMKANESVTLHDNQKSDIWSLGMIFWEIATRRLPFESITDDARVAYFISQGITPKIPVDTTQVFSVIQKCWSLEPSDRSSASDIALQLEILLHSNAEDSSLILTSSKEEISG